MGYVPDWQRQNMKKTGQSGPTTTNSRKDMGSLFHSSPANQHKSVSTPMRLADGDTEETYKARGQEASAGESVGFFERLRAGNIDQPGSEAYNRWGAGRAKADDAEVTRIANRAASAAADRARVDESDKAVEMPKYSGPDYKDTEFGDLEGAQKAAASRVSTSSTSTAAAPSRPAAAPVRRASSSVSGVSTSEATSRAYKPRQSMPDVNYGNEGRRTVRTAEAVDDTSTRTTQPTYESVTSERNSRLAYKTPFDRARREDNEAAASRKSNLEADRAALRANVRNKTSGDIDPKTLLPKR